MQETLKDYYDKFNKLIQEIRLLDISWDEKTEFLKDIAQDLIAEVVEIDSSDSFIRKSFNL
ncbi:hypothetical protein DWZ31_18440 [Roseburia intestinalis]|uniref:Uncharacterized protein n=1 Tax=Roseburia intestinalis TaxID=166486 RepID=A0A415TNH4_9FIRM|nr:hypothetical protein [Roseburia intestinalis]RHN03500.1 hypothetical protein DWZ31_18440 [Roseburia intestinalis]